MGKGHFLSEGMRVMSAWPAEEVRALALDEFDCRYVRYRLGASDEVRQRMLHSLERYGQLAPVVVFLHQDQPVLVDGFKRHEAARQARSLDQLLTRRIEADERSAKAAMYGLNRLGGHLDQLEEAWIVQALVREDGLSQPAVAQLLGRHKSWVCRRLALLEKLSEVVRDELGLGLVSASMARQLTRLPAGNQAETLATVRREDLNAAELRGVVDLLLGCSSRPQVEFVLEKPRQALRQAAGDIIRTYDPRLSVAGNRFARRLASLLDQLARMENWLRHQGLAALSACDHLPLQPGVARLGRDAGTVAELAEELAADLHGERLNDRTGSSKLDERTEA
jgi:ParB-like chromosome segregation protein Spo0J